MNLPMNPIHPFSLARRPAAACALALAGSALLLCAPGCRRKAEPQAAPEAAAPVAPEPKSAVQARMESPEYLAELKAIQADRQAKAAEASQLQAKMEARAKAFEAGNEKAAALRGEIEALRKQVGEKEATLAGLVREDPDYQALDAEFKGKVAELDVIRDRAVAAVHAKMQSQVRPKAAGKTEDLVAARRVPVKVADTNALQVVRPSDRPDRPPTPPAPPKAPEAPAPAAGAAGGSETVAPRGA